MKLNINEACVLNSAERVPYLLLIEYLSDEIDFNPFTDYNQKIINAKFEKSDSKTNDQINARDDASIVSQPKEFTELDGPFNEIYSEETDLGELPMLHLRSSSRNGQNWVQQVLLQDLHKWTIRTTWVTHLLFPVPLIP